jgi:hypothetical protein
MSGLSPRLEAATLGVVLHWDAPVLNDMNTRPKRENRVFIGMVLLTILVAGCELLSFVFTELRLELFDWRETFSGLSSTFFGAAH